MNRLKRQLLRKKLYTKNRLVILNENTFEEIFSLRLTLMNVFVVGSLGAIFIITTTTFLIAFTPLREYIPAYNEGPTIDNILNKIKAVDLLQDLQKEILIVNDCSTDNTAKSIQDFIAKSCI